MEEFEHITELVILRKKLPEIRRMMKKPIDEITEYCLNLRELLELPERAITEVPEKRNDAAKAALKEGNIFHKEGNNVKAIESFNFGILSGDFTKRKDSEPKDNVVALSFGGRSAATFELARYQECLKDIDRAIEHGYSLMLLSKLRERQAKCLIALGKKEEADRVIDDSLVELDNLKLGSGVSASRASLKELKLISNPSDLKESSEVDKDSSGLEVFPPYDIPLLKDPHQDIPSLSSAVDISVSKAKGRYLVANRDINPGDIILSEEIFASVLHEQFYKTNCSYCLSKTNFPIPCPTCDLVAFCSEGCRTSALKEFHSIECKILPMMTELGVKPSQRLALRIVVKVGLILLRERISQYSEQRIHTPPSKYGFNENAIYSSSDYMTIYNLVTNKEERNLKLWDLIVVAYLILRLLDKTSFFNVENPSTSDKKPVFHALLIHLMNVEDNSYNINQCSLDPEDKITFQIVGQGISSVYSLVGHSCDSNTAAFSFPSVTLTRAVEFIPKGTEITITYSDNKHGEKTLQARQESLLKDFHFQCKCLACLEQWPLEQSPQGQIYRVTQCKAHSHLGVTCPPECPMAEIQDNLNDIYLTFALSANEFRPIKTNIECYIEQYKEIIVKLCQYASFPCPDLMFLKDSLKNEYNRLGFVYYSNTSSDDPE